MYVVGLTGGMGSGKSTVAARLAELGCDIIDADQVAREVVEPGQPALREIAERFGPEVITDGALDRQAVADIVFGDDQARRDLEAITHPRIGARITQRFQELAEAEAEDGRQRIVVVDHPLLVEAGQAANYPSVIVVVAPAEVRVKRLADGRGIDSEDARARIATQASDEERLEAATHVIRNDGDLDHLYAQVDEVMDDLRHLAADVPVTG